MTASEKLKFELLVREELLSERNLGESIGTYKEKRLHRILKKFFESDESRHEKKIGPYIADIFRENEIIEIQTGSFFPMRDKLSYYLNETDLSVTIVRPLPHIKWCVWLDRESGEIVSRRKSSKKAMPIDVMRDWQFVSEHLDNKCLKIVFLLLEEEEYRFLSRYGKNGKSHSKRYERMPIKLIDEIVFCGAEDYLVFLPDELNEEFNASEYMKLMKLRSYGAYAALKMLCQLGFIEKSKVRKGRSFVYKRIP